MKKTPKSSSEASQQQHDPLDATTRRRVDFYLSRPKYPPAWAPDPACPELRYWVRGLTPQQMHAEILNRLSIRTRLVTRILAAWPGAVEEMFGFPFDEEEAAFPTLFLFLERITIDDPSIEGDGKHFPMLSTTGPSEYPQHVSEEFIHRVEHHPHSIQNIRATFRKLFLTWLFTPSPLEGKSLAEYQELRNAIKTLGNRNRPRRLVVNELFSRGPSVLLGGRTYPVPKRWKRDISSRQPPAAIARLLLADKWKLDPQAVKELLVKLAKQDPITVAWTGYAQWLRDNPVPHDKIRVAICPRPTIVAWPREWAGE